MKSHLNSVMNSAFLVLALFSVSAQAGNEGPHAVPLPPEKVLAEVRLRAMFPRIQAAGVKILDGGQVFEFHNTTQRPIAQLSESAVKNLKEAIERVQEAELVDPAAGKPFCYDGPFITHVVKNAVGKEITVQEHSGCHTSSLPDHSADLLIQLLDAFQLL